MPQLKKVTHTSVTHADNDKLFNPTFILAWIVNFAQFLVFYILITTMAVYAVTQFGASDTAGGFAASSFVVGATVARLFSGYVVDAVGRRSSLLVSLVLVVVSCVLYFPAHSLAVLIPVRFVHGVGYAVTSTAIMAVAQAVIPNRKRAEGTGYFALGTTLATAIGPAIGLFLANGPGYTTMFVVVSALTIIDLVVALFLKVPESNRDSRPKFTLAAVVHPRVAPIGVFMFLVGIGYTGVVTFLNSYAHATGLTAGAGLFFIAYALMTFAMRFFLGRLQDRRGDNSVIYITLAGFIAGLALLATATADWHVVLAGSLVGLGYGSIMPAVQAISVRLVKREEMGAGISTMFLFLDLGVGLGPIFLGMLISSTGYSAMYWLLAGLIVMAGCVYYLVHGRTDAAKGSNLHTEDI